MRNLKTGLLLVLLIVGLTSVVFAANVHFNSASARRQGNNLIVSFKISGLGNSETITVTASARATAVYQCFNNGGNHPQAGNKEQVIANVTASGSFTSDRNGTVSGSLTLTPPPPTLQCPNGQHLVLVSVKYENVSVSGGGATRSISGTF